MNKEEQDRLLRQLADTFIDVANKHIEQHDKNVVNTGFMYAAARFSAFIAASSANNVEQFQGQQEEAVEFFTNEFRKMLASNLKGYEKAFQQQAQQAEEQPVNRYDHLVKK